MEYDGKITVGVLATMEVVRDLADTIIGNQSAEDSDSEPSAETVLIRPRDSQEALARSSSYVINTDASVFSRDVDNWISGDGIPGEPRAQGSRAPSVQRSVPLTSSSLESSGAWFLAAMLLPLIDIQHRLWRCTPSTVFNTAELLLTQLSQLLRQVRSQVRRLAHEQAARDIFATAMDIVLVIYAIGFLVLSMYQAAIIGH